MRRKSTIALAGILVFLWILPTTVSAHHRKEVLGDTTTDTTLLQIPPTIEGPGLVLPDSPVFFLDEIKQNTRLFFAFNPEEKAKIHAQIAGERMAELRFMLARDNKTGARIALLGIADNLQKAANGLSQAKLTGKDISSVAKTINDDIKRKQETLDILESQASGEMKAQVKTVQESLLEAKVEVEDALPQHEIAAEIEGDLSRHASKRVEDVSDSVRVIEHDLAELEKQASEAATKELVRREDALKKAIEEKNGELKKEQERLLEAEKKRQLTLGKAQAEAVDAAREAVKKAQEAAIKFQKAQEATIQLKQSAGTSETSTNKVL